jgi:hypothetical protein
MKLLPLAMAFLILASAVSYSDPSTEKAASIADAFVKSHGVFYNKGSEPTGLRLFRQEWTRTEDTVLFVYQAKATVRGKEVSANFIVTVDTASMAVSSVRLIPKSSLEPRAAL